MSKIALSNGQYADLIIAADTDVGGVYPLPNGQYAQTVVPVDVDGNVITGGSGNGFTYDQQAVPSSPTRGQTWRERDSNSDIVEEWFWNGTYWLTKPAISQQRNDIFSPSSAALVCQLPFRNGITSYFVYSVFYALQLDQANTDTDYWYLIHNANALGSGSTGSNVALTGTNVDTKNLASGAQRITAIINTALIGVTVQNQPYISLIRNGTTVTRQGSCIVSVRLSAIRV